MTTTRPSQLMMTAFVLAAPALIAAAAHPMLQIAALVVA